MAITVTPNLTDISLCEATTGWTGSPAPILNDTTIWDAVQGSRCLQSYSAGAAVRNAVYDFGTTSGYWKNFSEQILIIWFSFSRKAYSATNPPMKIRLTDGNGYYRDWYIFDKTTLPHTGWIPWIIHADFGYDYESNPSFNVTQIRYVGWKIEETVVGKTYIWWDAVRFGTGLTIKGGDSGSPATFENLYISSVDQNNAYGLVDKIGGVYYSNGKINIGSLTVDESTYFKDTSQVFIFKNIKGNPTGFYEIKGQNAVSGSGTTEIYLGDPTTGVSGCFIKAPLVMKFKLTMSDINITKFSFNGCIFVNSDIIALQPYNVNKKIISCNFESCAKLIANTCTVNKCKFISAPGDAVLISNDPYYVTDCQFIGCTRGVELDTVGDGEYEFNALKFTNTTYHVNNTSGSTLTVANGNGANASTYTGTLVNFTGSVQLTITVTNEVGEPIVGAFAYIDDQDQSPFIMNTTTNEEGIATVGYTGAPVIDAKWRVRKYGYKNFKQLIDIVSSNIDLPVTLIVDPQQT